MAVSDIGTTTSDAHPSQPALTHGRTSILKIAFFVDNDSLAATLTHFWFWERTEITKVA